ncbi:MAG: hypothetical protein ACFBZ8_06740 [Opitutales bacterium]
MGSIPVSIEDLWGVLKRRWRLFSLGVLVGAGLVTVAILSPLTWEEIFAQAKALINWLEVTSQAYPLLLVVALALLPLTGFPASVLLVLCGAHGPALGFLMGLTGLTLNTVIVYTLGTRILCRPAQMVCRWRGVSVPQVPEGQAVKFSFAVRLLPGPPPVLQGIVLSLGGVPFGTYLWVTMTVQGAMTLGFVLVGLSLFEGGSGLAIAGLAVILGLALLARLYTQRNARTPRPPEPQAHPEPRARPEPRRRDRTERGRADAADQTATGD